MPLVTVSMVRPVARDNKQAVLDAVHRALVEIGVPPTDRFQRVLELEPEDFVYDAKYPDLTRPRTDRFVLIEVLFSVGRSVKVKRTFLDTLMADLRTRGFDPEHVMVVFKETAWENWSFGGGRLLHAG